jgi:hypothetical protein
VVCGERLQPAAADSTAAPSADAAATLLEWAYTTNTSAESKQQCECFARHAMDGCCCLDVQQLKSPRCLASCCWVLCVHRCMLLVSRI